MQPHTAIHDMYIRELSASPEAGIQRVTILADHDHLLRRFGLSEAVWLASGEVTGLLVRSVADELWALLEGSVEFVWHDLRAGSPTRDRWHRLVCAQPTLVLAPFGVAFGARGLAERSLLLRLATHAEADPDDTMIPWEARP
jgi:hypothetical protein